MLQFFNKDLDTMELKFIGFFFILVLGVVALILQIDLITGFLGGIVAMIVRDLYRTNTNEAPRGLNGNKKEEVEK